MVNYELYVQLYLIHYMGATATKEPHEETEDSPPPPRINHHRFQNSTFSTTKDQEEIITIRIPVANEK